MISVVMPARDAAHTIADALAALGGQDYPGDWEAIVVDDGSRDETAAIARRALVSLPGARLLAGSGYGSAAARNLGAASANGDLLAFCDADDVARPGWLRGLAAAAEEAEIVTGAFRFDGLNEDWLRLANSAPEFTQGPLVGHRFLPFASGGNCAYRRESFESFGGFDERFRFGQDMELSWRMQLGGCRLAHAPGAVVECRLRDRPGGLARQSARWGVANARLYARYRNRGMPPPDLREAFIEWCRLLALAPAASVSSARRAAWARRLGLRAGQLVGSLRYGVLFP